MYSNSLIAAQSKGQQLCLQDFVIINKQILLTLVCSQLTRLKIQRQLWARTLWHRKLSSRKVVTRPFLGSTYQYMSTCEENGVVLSVGGKDSLFPSSHMFSRLYEKILNGVCSYVLLKIGWGYGCWLKLLLCSSVCWMYMTVFFEGNLIDSRKNKNGQL